MAIVRNRFFRTCALLHADTLSPVRGIFFATLSFSLLTKVILVGVAADARLGWDEVVYLHHANAIRAAIVALDPQAFYSQYFYVRGDIIRFFPPGSPLGYAVFGILVDGSIIGARLYNALLISIGIASSAAIVWILTKRKDPVIATVALMNLSVVGNAYTLFLWSEGAQFGAFTLALLLLMTGPLTNIRLLLIGGLIAWLCLAHASSVLFAMSLVGYALIFKQPFTITAWTNTSVRLLGPAFVALVIWGMVAKPVLGEFVVASSESIPMSSLQNPPSSYGKTWTTLRARAAQDGTSLASASSRIAWEYMQQKGLSFVVDRGFRTLKKALVADAFPQRHIQNGLWPFLPKGWTGPIIVANHLFYFFGVFGLVLFVSRPTFAPESILLCTLFALKVGLLFVTAVSSTRYMTTFHLIAFPFAIVGLSMAVSSLLRRENLSCLLLTAAWATFFAFTTV